MEDILLNMDEAEYITVSEDVINRIFEEVEGVLSVDSALSEDNLMEEGEENETGSRIIVLSSNDTYNYYYNQVVDNVEEALSENTVSDNIIDKQLTDYSTQEGLLFLILSGLMIAAIVFIIRKGVYRWN